MKLVALQLSGSHLDGNRACCTGPQIALVLNALMVEPVLAACNWYAASIETYPAFGVYEGTALEEIADFAALIEKVHAAQQLFDGVFLAVPNTQPPDVIWPRITADGAMNKIARNSVVEVRAFDTSWIEMYSECSALMASVQRSLGGELVEANP